ncbi:MAG: serine hydrolase [Proteobacteria bacterium]|nr:serine hydrolase [Pseudomonadota bacterium]
MITDLVTTSDSQRAALATIGSICERAKSDRLFSSAAYFIGSVKGNKNELSGAFGSSGEKGAHSIDQIFDLSSLTKALVTTPLVLAKTYELGLDEAVEIGSIFSTGSFEGIESAKPLNLSAVLRHEAGLPFWRNFYVSCGDGLPRSTVEVLRRALAERRTPPQNLYSDIGMILLGHLLSVDAGQNLETLFSEFCTHKLKIPESLKVGPGRKFAPELCLPTGFCALRGRELRGEVHDENAWALGGFAGHAGLFGSVQQVIIYLRALSHTDIGAQVIAHNDRWARKNSNSDSALGWRTGRDASSRIFGGGAAIGHLGFTGTAFWLDVATGRVAVLLTNRVAMERTKTLPRMKIFRAEFFQAAQEYFMRVEASSV